MARYLMTHSLMSSWLYALKESPYEDATTKQDPLAEFVSTLNREQRTPNAAMINGITFEDLVTAILNRVQMFEYYEMDKRTEVIQKYRVKTDEHKWYNAACRVANIVSRGVLQYKVSKAIEVGGMTLVLYGRLDCLKSGEIYDIKFSGKYDRGKYIDSTQHPTYLELVPEARGFTYIVSSGSDVWTERYRRDETQSILPTISDFLNWLQATGFMNTYKEKWLAK